MHCRSGLQTRSFDSVGAITSNSLFSHCVCVWHTLLLVLDGGSTSNSPALQGEIGKHTLSNNADGGDDWYSLSAEHTVKGVHTLSVLNVAAVLSYSTNSENATLHRVNGKHVV